MFSKNFFQNCMNEKFQVIFDPNNSYELELVEVADKGTIDSLNIECYALIFKGDRANKVFVQGNYKLTSEKSGEITLFLIPRLPDDEGIYYEAIFS